MTYDGDGNLTSDHRRRRAHHQLQLRRAEPQDRRVRRPVRRPRRRSASWVYDNSNNVVRGHRPDRPADHRDLLHRRQRLHPAAERLQRLRRVPRRDPHPALGRRCPGGQLRPHPPVLQHHWLLLRDTYPASPGGGALPAETVTHGYETGFDLPDGLGGTLAAYGQQVTYTAFSQVAQEEIGTTTNNAYVTNTYDPNTGALKTPRWRTPPSPAPRTTTPPTPTTRPGTSPPRPTPATARPPRRSASTTTPWTGSPRPGPPPTTAPPTRPVTTAPPLGMDQRRCVLDELGRSTRSVTGPPRPQHSLTGGTDTRHELQLQRQRPASRTR